MNAAEIQRKKAEISDLRARTDALKQSFAKGGEDHNAVLSIDRTLNQCSAVLNRYAS
jgi:hypothetical protein